MMDLIANSISITKELDSKFIQVIEYFLNEIANLFKDTWIPYFSNFFSALSEYIEEILLSELFVCLLHFISLCFYRLLIKNSVCYFSCRDSQKTKTMPSLCSWIIYLFATYSLTTSNKLIIMRSLIIL